MTTYWTYHGSTNYLGIDEPVHAGITHDLIYQNLTCAYEQSGMDIIMHFDIVQDGIKLSGSYTWCDRVKPLPIPLYGSSAGWHELKISTVIHASATVDLRTFVLPESVNLNDETMIDAYDSSFYEDTSESSGEQEHVVTITPPDARRITNGETFINVIWLYYAADSSDSTLLFSHVRIREMI